MTTIRCCLALDVVRGWPLFQLDADNTFLHGSLDGEVYMKLPTGFYGTEKKQGQVCCLLKSLYDLKQASVNGLLSSAMHLLNWALCLVSTTAPFLPYIEETIY
ncbi:unnamed protein product [Rhodiola kirilowii]